jgi:uncharacterized protein involved in outer membrane biogenesis
MDPLSFDLDQGKFAGRVQIDARRDVPQTAIDMTIDGVDLSQFKTKTMTQPPLCGVLDFQARQGALNAKNLFVETTDVLIQGGGDVQLRSEELDLAIHGDPKKLRLTRVRTPITVKGTLRHPAVGIDVGKLAGQGAVATALGTLLTPVAAVIAFIDPGRAKDKDCVASVNEASAPIEN